MFAYAQAAALVAASSLLLTPVTAHMLINSPPPTQQSATKDPLDASGDNFPCHQWVAPSAGGTKMAAGSSQTLSWHLGGGANTATHGGGSCQMSITYETDAAKVKDPKNWYVIHSFEGGCMTQNLGNLPTSINCAADQQYGDNCVNTFNFTIPKGVKNGNAIMAWTWFNNVGNRELYMNCINTELSGGDGSEMDTFPSLFVANMADVNQCATVEEKTTLFPFPGKYVTKAPKYNYPAAVPAGCEDIGAPASGNDGADSNSSPSPSPSASASSSASSSSTANTAPTPSSSASSTSSTAAQPSASGSGSSSSSGSCTNGKLKCSKPGQIFCIGNTQWAECDVDNCAVPMSLAAGTQCKNGQFYRRGHVRHVARHAAKVQGYPW